MSAFKFELTGAKELERALNSLPYRLEKNAARAGARAGAAVVRKEAKALIPVDTGETRRTVKTRSRNRRVGDAVVAVTVSGRLSKLLSLEFGSSRQAAQPFLRRALHNKANQAIKAMATKIQDWIAKQAAK